MTTAILVLGHAVRRQHKVGANKTKSPNVSGRIKSAERGAAVGGAGTGAEAAIISGRYLARGRATEFDRLAYDRQAQAAGKHCLS